LSKPIQAHSHPNAAPTTNDDTTLPFSLPAAHKENLNLWFENNILLSPLTIAGAQESAPFRSTSELCRAILRCADGLPSKSVAAELGIHEHTVGKRRRRFLKDRCDGLLDEGRPGRARTISDDQAAAVIERTLRTTPVDATHRSISLRATETGFSNTPIRRMWAS
jgi:transposase